MAMRIVLADDHVMVRECLAMFLKTEGFDVVGMAGDGIEALKQVEALHPQVALLDFAMPGLNGIDAAREVLNHPGTKPVLLTAYSEDQYVIEALKAGVVGYVLKSKAVQHLVQALQEVEKGNVYLSPGISRAVVHEMLNKNKPFEVLSPRERQLLQLIAEGKTTKEAAHELGISTRTADSHRSNIMEKLDIHETASLVRYAIRRGIIQP
jgi:two-component system, NarL family, response regulator NreC